VALIADPQSGTVAKVHDAASALRVMLYGPDGTPLVSQMRGGAVNLRTDGGTEERDGVAILLPGTAKSVVGGTAAAPLRTDPTGTTEQPVKGTVGLAAGTAVLIGTPGGAPLPVAFASRQPVAVDFPSSQAVSFGGTAQPVTFPSAQPITGSVNANARVGGVDVSATNPVPVLGALRVGAADVDGGNPVPVRVIEAPVDLGFTTVIDVVPSTLTAGTPYWALRNTGGRTIYLRRFDLQQGFTTATAAAARSSFELIRFTGTPTSGTAVAPAKKLSTSSASIASVVTLAAGLAGTLTYDAGPVHRFASAHVNAAAPAHDVQFTDEVVLLPGEGIALRANGALPAVGSFVIGSVGWYER
jgi:hypothetical protein